MFVFAMAAFSGCADGDLFNPNRGGPVQLALRPYFAVNGGSAMVDINQVRVTVHRRPGGEIVSQEVTPVDPAATSYNLTLDVPANSDLRILIELLNTVGGVTTVQFSGEIELSVTTGPQNTAPTDIPVFPGGPENLTITAVSIAPRNHSMLEGETVRLQANVTGGPANPVITWISLNSAVATVGPDGTVTAVRPGNAVITAQAGPRLDNVTVEVGARVTAVLVSPSAPVAASLGTDVTFTARVVDVRNNDVPGFGVTWSIADPNIATQVTPGVFRARRNGTTTISATTTQFGRTVAGTAALKVEQRPVTLVLDPASATMNAFGATQTFSAQGRDAAENPVDGLVFTWASSAPAVATVDANGVVTARANGVTTITASGGGASAEARVTVAQAAVGLVVSPSEKTLESIGESVQLTAELRDARGNVMAAPVVWTSTLAGIATVNENGLVTATGDGTVVISARAAGSQGSATITVERVARSVLIEPATFELNAGSTITLRAFATDANGAPMRNLPVTWSSSNSAIATVNAAGVVSGVRAGDVIISAISGGNSASAQGLVKGSTSTGVSIVPTGSVSTSNCIPFGQSASFGTFQGFIYRNVPAFTMNAGDKIAFDLGGLNGQDIRRDVYFGIANINPAADPQTQNVTSQGVRALSWVKVATEAQTPANPRGNNIQGDYELVWTAEAPFSFPGGGFIVGFAAPTIVDSGCEQVLVQTNAADPSGLFHARFYNKLPATMSILDDQTGGNATAIGGIKIYPAGPATSAITLVSRPVTPSVSASPAAAGPLSEVAGTPEWFAKYGKPATHQMPVIKKKSESETIK